MKPINKLILYIVHNWKNELNEAYSAAFISKYLEKFKEEAEDFNINISDEELKNYITTFDKIKNANKITDKELGNYTLAQLIKTVGKYNINPKPEEAIDETPDIVYNQDGLVIYNGARKENCIKYGKGESWCIVRGSWESYRYDRSRKNPTFYLVKDNNPNIPHRKSFFVVVVGSDDTYKVSDRSNNDVGGRQTEWERWEPWSFVEKEFPSLKGLKNIFKYISITNTEIEFNKYKHNPISYKEWEKFTTAEKKQYIVIRKTNGSLFNDMSNDTFVIKYLKEYPLISEFISTNNGLINTKILLRHLEVFSNQEINSILANIRNDGDENGNIDENTIEDPSISFLAKKLLILKNKIKLNGGRFAYFNEKRNVVVMLAYTHPLRLTIVNQEETYPNVNINKRTDAYIQEYPKLAELNPEALEKLHNELIISDEILVKSIDLLKTKGDEGIIVKDSINDDGDNDEIIINLNNYTAYRWNSEAKSIRTLDFFVHTVQSLLGEPEKAFLKKNVVKLFNYVEGPIPKYNADMLRFASSIIEEIPYSERITNENIILTTGVAPGSGTSKIVFLKHSSPLQNSTIISIRWTNGGANRDVLLSINEWRAYFAFMRSTGQEYVGDSLITILNDIHGREQKSYFLNATPPVGESSLYAIISTGSGYIFVNKENPRESKRLGANQLRSLVLTQAKADAYLGRTTPTAATRRGRPAGGTNTPVTAAPVAAPAVVGNTSVAERIGYFGLGNGFNSLHRQIFRTLAVTNAIQLPPNDRGSSNRNNQLRGVGSVVEVLSIPSRDQPTKIYIIRKNNGSYIASINIQPGNYNFIITSTGFYSVSNPRQLMNTINQHNLAEMRNYVIREYLLNYPNQIKEIKKAINEKIRTTRGNK